MCFVFDSVAFPPATYGIGQVASFPPSPIPFQTFCRRYGGLGAIPNLVLNSSWLLGE